jgi:hypothetical protein
VIPAPLIPAPANPAPPNRPRDWAAWAIWLFVALLVAIGAVAISQQHPTTLAWQATRALPSYHVITTADVSVVAINTSSRPAGALPLASPVGQYTRQPVAAQAILRGSDLAATADPTLITNTTPMAFPASAAMAFNGQLAPGAVVALWSVGPPGAAIPISGQPLLQRVLVLDDQRVAPTPSAGDPFVIVLAIPNGRRADVLAAAASNKLSLSVQP